jgi:hypothetical protein
LKIAIFYALIALDLDTATHNLFSSFKVINSFVLIALSYLELLRLSKALWRSYQAILYTVATLVGTSDNADKDLADAADAGGTFYFLDNHLPRWLS